MKSFFFKRIYLFIFLALLAGQTQGAALELSLPGMGKTTPSESKTPLSFTQLRSFLMDFADRYMQMVGQAADTLQKENRDPDSRVAIQSIKLFSCSAAFSIAIDANPHMALLNMEVLVHLQGSIWRDEASKKFGEKAAFLLNVQKELEDDIDAIALKALTPEQLEELKALVAEWRAEHPDQRYVSYIRFSDFTGMRSNRHAKTPNLLSVSGLLSAFQFVNVDEATRSVDQARMVAERAIYLSQRIPSLLRWQTEMLFYQMAVTPETKNIMGAVQTLNNLPVLMAAERKAAIEQLVKEAVRESRTIIWEWAKACLVIIFAVFLLTLLYKTLSRRI